MDLLEALQKFGGGGVFGLAIYCILKLREQRSSDLRGERADDRDDRKAEIEGFGLVTASQKEILETWKALYAEALEERKAAKIEAQEYRGKFNDCEEECSRLTAEVESLKFRNAHLETILKGVEFLDNGSITPEALRRAADRQEARDAITPHPEPKPLRVLFVEDYGPTLQLTMRQLRDEPYELQTACDGMEALKLYEQARADGAPFDLLVLDLMMPGLGGKSVARTVRESGDAQTKMMYYTAHIEGVRDHQGNPLPDLIELNIATAVTKPADEDELMLAIRRVLNLP